jgi:hypothetical protein
MNAYFTNQFVKLMLLEKLLKDTSIVVDYGTPILRQTMKGCVDGISQSESIAIDVQLN